MLLLIVGLILWIILLVSNTAYSFLPAEMQGILWIKVAAALSAIIILFVGIKQAVNEF